ncbi:MAG: M56 family metallopeptidase [Phycisphaerae bacterium]
MIALENILSQEIVQRLGWTLLHFIWQAAVVALLLAILLRILRKSAANLRYIFACLALGLIVLLPVITIQWVPVFAPNIAARIAPAPVSTVLPTLEMPAAETIVIEKPAQSEIVTPSSSVPWKQRAIDTLEPSLPYIVLGWLIGVFALSLWHLGGWTQLQRLRRRMVKQVDGTLHSKLKVLAQRLRVKQTVQLMESALVQIPTVVGWLRPVILLPASALTGLSSEQLEAILAHELAHIRRCDYLINILQTIVEILGFYHPAVWWISYKIRAERENCCDDLAVSISGDRVCYAKALTSMEEIRAGYGRLAVAAGGGNLFKRIYRLLGKDSNDKTSFSWIPAVTVILLIIALVIPTTFALTNKSNPQQIEQKTNVLFEDKQTVSADKLKWLGLAVAMYADEHNDNLPDSVKEVKPYLRDEQDFSWLLDNVEYFGRGKSAQRNAARIPIAYDKSLFIETDATNVLFLDFSVRFLDAKEFEKLDIKRAELLIEARFLSVSEDFLQNIGRDANSPDEAKALLRLRSELLAASDGSKTKSFILDDSKVKLLNGAVQAHKDSRVLAAPQILTREGKTAEIRVLNKETYYVSGYTEPNRPSKEPQPKIDKVEEGISLSVKPRLTPNKNIDLVFELEITQVLGLEERMYKDKYPYKHWTVQRIAQSARYRAHNGQTLLCWGHKISKQQDGRTEQKDLLVLIKAETVGSPEQDKSTQAEDPTVAEPGKSTSDVIVKPGIVKGRTVWPNDNELEPDVQVERKVSMEQQVYDISDLVVTAADANDLIRRITTTIEPDSWYKLSEKGYGTIIAYPVRQPKKFAVMQTWKIQQKIRRLLEDMHASQGNQIKTKAALQVEDSTQRLLNLGHALLIYANDHDDKYPLSLRRLRDYLNLEEFNWALANVEYLGHGKTIAVRPDVVIAYDKMLLTKGKGTNVLFNDSHVEFVKPERLKELGISATEIQIETKILLVSEDFLQSIGLDANSVSSSDAWSEHLAAKYAAEPNSTTYILILDDLHVSFLLKAVGAHKGASVLAAPQVLTREGRTAEIGIMTEEYYVLGYTEPNDPSDKPEPKNDKVELGTRLWLEPELTPDSEKIKLDFKMEMRQLLGYEERKYKGKYIYLVPRTEVVSTEMPCLIPDGKTLLIGGQKITEQVSQVSAAPILSKLPVVGELFRSRDKTRDQRILLILVKPVINPQQKARKILPGQEDSEEHIKSLANQLEKKLNPPAD